MPEDDEKREGAQSPEADRGEAFAASIDKFFEEVTRGVVEAQRDLDAKSEEYLRKRSPISMPAVFRIPRVSAEFTLNAERSRSGGINFIVSSSSGRRDALQQKVSFDIISVPPAVDEQAAAEMAASTPLAAESPTVMEQIPADVMPASEEIEAEVVDPAPGGEIEPDAMVEAGTDEAEPGEAEAGKAEAGEAEPEEAGAGEVESKTLSLNELVMALARVRNREDTKYDERKIAQQLVVNKDSLFLIEHPTHHIALYSPDPQQEGNRDLVMALIDRTAEEAVPEVYTTDKEHTQEARRFQVIVQRLAELAAGHGRR